MVIAQDKRRVGHGMAGIVGGREGVTFCVSEEGWAADRDFDVPQAAVLGRDRRNGQIHQGVRVVVPLSNLNILQASVQSCRDSVFVHSSALAMLVTLPRYGLPGCPKEVTEKHRIRRVSLLHHTKRDTSRRFRSFLLACGTDTM